ncbi:hypothetical protein PIB30_091562, partial [Stylosanthes scabra]|nr:hypothetical protein [Stylosanthes scabra]
MLSVLRKFSLCVFTAGVNSATHLKTPFSVNFSQNRRRRCARKDPKPWDTKFRSERRFIELETRSPEKAPVAGIPRLKTATSATRHRHMSLRRLESSETGLSPPAFPGNFIDNKIQSKEIGIKWDLI